MLLGEFEGDLFDVAALEHAFRHARGPHPDSIGLVPALLVDRKVVAFV
jgi:hypothetical protein